MSARFRCVNCTLGCPRTHTLEPISWWIDGGLAVPVRSSPLDGLYAKERGHEAFAVCITRLRGAGGDWRGRGRLGPSQRAGLELRARSPRIQVTEQAVIRGT